MTSIFNLPTSVDELSSMNNGTTNARKLKQAPTRAVDGTNFPNGTIQFRWQTSGNTWFVPSKSYIRTRCKLTKADGVTPLTKADAIGPSMGMMSNLFQSADMQLESKTICRVADYMPQIDALETRLNESKAWIDSVGSSTNFWDEDIKKRINAVSSDGTKQAADTLEKTTVGRLALGFDANNTIGYDEKTGVVTFAAGGGVAPNLTTTNYFRPGDYLIFDAAGVEMRVIAITAALTMTVEPLEFAARAPAATAFSRVRYGKKARQVSEFETVWQPPLAVFKNAHAMPGGRYELNLNPQNSAVYKGLAIESLGANKVAGVDFEFSIESMYFYIHLVDGPRYDNLTYLIDLDNCSAQTDKIQSTAFSEKVFDVAKSTTALTVAYQDLRAQSDTRVTQTKFKVQNAALAADSRDTEELKLNRFYINYAGQNYPQVDSDPDFSTNTDRTTQRYVESLLESGGYFDVGGSEPIEEFHDRGSYYHFKTPRDGSDASTRVTTHQQFNAADVDNLRVLVFSHSKAVARVTIQNSVVTSVDVEEQ